MRTLRIGVVLGLLAGIAAAVRRRLAGPDHRAPAALSVAPAATAPAPSPVPVPALDVDAALGPDTQPLRAPDPPPPPLPLPLPEPEVEVHTGAEAVVAAADLDRQPAQAAPDWQPPADGAATTAAEGAWMAAEGAACPATHPVKAKLPSRIYHLPGMANYSRTVPDRCYADGDAAEADGFRKAKR